jgi:hypothetical protein
MDLGPTQQPHSDCTPINVSEKWKAVLPSPHLLAVQNAAALDPSLRSFCGM